MNISFYIDHTILKPDAKRSDIEKICKEAMQYSFASVCVNSCYVSLVRNLLKDSKVKVCTVIGFPLGACSTEAKVCETQKALLDGANEFDMVINVGALKSGEYEFVLNDIKEVVETVGNKGIVKVIIETCLLTEEEKTKACQIAKTAGAHFVKTSTGFSTGGATTEDIKLMRSVVRNEMGVKASGGIRDYKTAMEMISAGANRIGASASVSIATQKEGAE